MKFSSKREKIVMIDEIMENATNNMMQLFELNALADIAIIISNIKEYDL